MDYINVEIRKMTIEDLPSVLEIENLCFVSKWSEKDFLYELNENKVSNLWVIELSASSTNQKSVVGFIDFWITFDSATISQIAIHPDIQHRQLGSALMDEMYNECFAKKVRNITLEVRKSNQKAIKFYEKHGFKTVLTKPHYYQNGEDALYMILEVK